MDGQDPNVNNAADGQPEGAPANEFVNFGAVGQDQQDGQPAPGMNEGGVVGGAGEGGDDENADYFDDGGETFLPADHVSYTILEPFWPQ